MHFLGHQSMIHYSPLPKRTTQNADKMRSLFGIVFIQMCFRRQSSWLFRGWLLLRVLLRGTSMLFSLILVVLISFGTVNFRTVSEIK